MNTSQLYIEAFVDCTEWRWRVYESDPGMLHIEYQEWDETTKGWKAREHVVSFSAEYAEQICKAIQTVKANTIHA